MSSEPVVVQVLEGDNAITKYRDIMGSTDPLQAKEGTIRKKIAISKQENSVHGSDSLENANLEIDFFYNKDEIVGSQFVIENGGSVEVIDLLPGFSRTKIISGISENFRFVLNSFMCLPRTSVV